MLKMALKILGMLLKMGIIQFEAKISIPEEVKSKVLKALEDDKITGQELGDIILSLVKE